MNAADGVTTDSTLHRGSESDLFGKHQWIDFLRECGATVDCGAGEILLSAFTEGFQRCHGTLAVTDDICLQPQSLSRVPVDTPAVDAGTFDVLVEPVPLNCAKKNMLVPPCALSITDGRSSLWVLNCSSEPVVLPSRMRLALFEEYASSCIAALSNETVDPVAVTHPTEDQFLGMVNKSLPSEKRLTLVHVLAKHATV